MMIFHWSLNDRKSPQVSRTLWSILPDLINAVVWIVSACPPICRVDLASFPSAPVTNGITVTALFHSFFSSLARSKYFSLFSRSLIFHSVVRWDGKVHNMASSPSFSHSVSVSVFCFHYVSSTSRDLVICLCCILTFDSAKYTIPKWCTGRKWHIPMALMRRNRVGGLG